GVSPSDIAVLYRAHAQSAVLQQALAARGVATSVLGGTRFFDMPEVRQAVLGLRGAAVAPSDVGFLPTVRDVLRGLGLTDEPPEAGGAQRDGWEARRAILRRAEEAPEGTTLRAFADDLMARAKDQHEPTLRTGTPSTLDPAQGLGRPCARRRDWSGRMCCWPAGLKERCRSRTPPRSRRSTRSGDWPTWASRGPRVRWRSRGLGAQVGGSGVRRASWQRSGRRLEAPA